MSQAKTNRPCVVCNRPLGREHVVDGVRVVACDDCLKDQFRRPRAVEFTLHGRPR